MAFYLQLGKLAFEREKIVEKCKNNSVNFFLISSHIHTLKMQLKIENILKGYDRRRRRCRLMMSNGI